MTDTSIVYFEDALDFYDALASARSGESAVSQQILLSGDIPSSAIETRPDGIKYIKHTYATTLLNRALGWRWDWEVLEHYMDPGDGSVAATVKYTEHIPIGVNPHTKEIIFHKRVITEIGSFQAYPKTKEILEERDGRMVRTGRSEPVTNSQGFPVYTMPASDRIASAVSRGLLRCLYRAYGFGAELYDSDMSPEYTVEDAWNTLLRIGLRKGLSESEIRELCKQKVQGNKENYLKLFPEIMRALETAAKEKTAQIQFPSKVYSKDGETS